MSLSYMLVSYCTLEGEPGNHVGPFETVADAIEFFEENFAGEFMECRVFPYTSPEDWNGDGQCLS